MVFATMAVATMAFPSCSDDDDDEKDEVRTENEKSNEKSDEKKDEWLGDWTHNMESSSVDLKMNGEAFPPQIVEELDFMKIMRGNISLREDGSFVSTVDKDTVQGTYGVNDGQFEITYDYLGSSITVKKGANLNEFLAADASLSSYAGLMDFFVKDFSLGFNAGRLNVTLLVESEINADLTGVAGLESIADLLPQGGISIDGKIVTAYDRKK